jgi:hypothetical protein
VSDDNLKSVSLSFGAFEMSIITLVLIGCKLTVAPDLPWPIVLAPIWLPLACILVIVGLPVVVMCLGLVAAVILGGLCIAWDFISGLWKEGTKP